MGFTPLGLNRALATGLLRLERLLRQTFDPVRFDGQESGTLQSECYRAWMNLRLACATGTPDKYSNCLGGAQNEA
jgi:hypothetical protein